MNLDIKEQLGELIESISYGVAILGILFASAFLLEEVLKYGISGVAEASIVIVTILSLIDYIHKHVPFFLWLMSSASLGGMMYIGLGISDPDMRLIAIIAFGIGSSLACFSISIRDWYRNRD